MGCLNQLEAPAALVLFDIDRFKAINDTLGHHAGDALLVNMAKLVHQHLRKEDLLARLGGDEFAIVLPGVTDAAAWTIAERIRKSVEQHVIRLGSDTVRAIISLGIAGIPTADSSADPSTLLRAADIALYAVERQGRTRLSDRRQDQLGT